MIEPPGVRDLIRLTAKDNRALCDLGIARARARGDDAALGRLVAVRAEWDAKANGEAPMKVTALAPFFGSNRMLAEHVGKHLDGCSWVGVPFAGGMCELAHIKARTLMVNDLHRQVINLAEIVAHPTLGAKLVRMLRRTPFHPNVLSAAQEDLLAPYDPGPPPMGPLQQAHAYFVCAWMSRNGTAGTKGEFSTGMSVRWEAGGGDSAVRFRSATESLREWRRILSRATFSVLDAFAFLTKCKDDYGHGIYCDPPFPGPGDAYKHAFTEADHHRLAETLTAFQITRVVCRFYDHPMIRHLYPEHGWKWHELTGRKQTNAAAPEVLLVRNSGW